MYQTYPNSGNVGAALGGAFLFGTLIYLVIMIVFIAAYWQMFKKAGYSGALSLLLLVPLANVVLILWFGFSEWPVVRENRELRGRLAGGGVGGPPTYPPAAMPPAYAPPAQPVAPPTYAPPAPAAPPPAYQPPPVAPAPEVAPSAPATPAYEPPPAAPTPPQTTPPPAPPGAEPPAGS